MEHLIILLLRFCNQEDMGVRSIFGVSVLLLIQWPMGDLLSNPKMLNKLIRK